MRSQFKIFPKPLPYSERVIRLGLAITTYRLSININLPYLISWVVYIKDFNLFVPSKKPLKRKNSKHIKEIKAGKFRLGIDTYDGEGALILPLFKLWIKLEPLAAINRRKRLFTFLSFIFKWSPYEILLHIKAMGCGIGIHIPLYELGFIGKARENRNRKFWAAYRPKT